MWYNVKRKFIRMKNRFVLKDKACPSKLFHAYEVSQPETQPSPADLMPQNASSACRSLL